MSAYRSSSRRSTPAEPQLPPEQLARIQAILASLVRRGSLTFTTTIRTDASGHTSAETQRKRTPVRAAEINSWRRLLFQLAQHGLLPDDVEPLPYELEGTVAELRLPWEGQLTAKLRGASEAGDRGQVNEGGAY